MDNQRVAEVLDTIAQILQLQGENMFKIRAYQNAARTVEGLGAPVADMVRDGKLAGVEGFGEALVKKVSELVQTGKMSYFEELKGSVPSGLLELLKIPSLGPKKAKILFDSLGVKSLRELEVACRDGKVAALKGFGSKSQANILEGIRWVGKHSGAFRLGDVLPVARYLVKYLKDSGQIQRIEVAGSTRRWKEVVKDLDILCTSTAPEQVMDHFVAANDVEVVLGKGPTKSSVRLRNGLQVDLRVVKDDEFAAALLYFTGSKEHNVKLRTLAVKMEMSINEYGVLKGDKRQTCATEAEIYELLGLKYVPPEAREGWLELGVELPALVEVGDLSGTFHVHSNWSDGTASIEAMANKARAMGLKYIGLSDHSEAAANANGLSADRLAKQLAEVDHLNSKWTDFRILKGAEVDILPDGRLDLSDEMLGRLDFVIGSIHGHLEMNESEMTDRVCKALDNKYLDILGHPTGRMLLDRDGIRIDLDRVIRTAVRNNKIIELNSNPHRMDFDSAQARRVRELGGMVTIDPDAHSVPALEHIEYGVGTARRAGMTKSQVLNARPLSDVMNLLARN